MADSDFRGAKLRHTLIVIILATLPCYLLGAIVLWIGDAAKESRTPTVEISTVIITATPQPSTTQAPPTAFPTLTATIVPTNTPTRTPTAIPTNTPEPPTSTFTLTPLPTDTPTETLTPTPAPTDTTPTAPTL